MFSVPLLRPRKRPVAGADGAPPTVFVTSRPPRHRLDYVDQLVGDDSAGEAPTGVVREYGTNPARAHDVDVVHLTDITHAIGGGLTSQYERARRAKRLVTLLRRQGTALVRSVQPDEAGRAPSRAEAILDRAVASFIALTPSTSATGHEAVVIAHSHLRARFLGFPREQAHAGRILITAHTTFGPAYEAVIKVFSAIEPGDWTLRIAGDVPEPLAESFSRTLGDHADTMSLRDEALSDAASVEEIGRAEIVLVTAPDSFEGQSLILWALSLDRPVLVDDSPATRSLADEVGQRWVHRYPAPLTAAKLEDALRGFRTDPPVGRPNLDAREPNEISAQYSAVFRATAGR